MFQSTTIPTPTRTIFPMIFGRPYSEKLNDGASTPLQLVRLHIEQKVNVNFPLIHQIATTMTFKNTHNIILEGAFEFTLPEKATICGYGLDVNGVIVDGVVVEKQAARIIFEKEVRKRIDPGFVELVTGNIFRTRVYPIEPQKTRTIRVIYQDQAIINNNSYIYQIPIQYQRELESLDITLTCFSEDIIKPEFLKNSNHFSQFIHKENGEYTAELHLTKVQPLIDSNQIISYLLPDSVKSVLTAIEKDLNSEENYFAISCVLPKSTEKKDLSSKTICILWDASISRSNSSENRLLELNFLKKIFDIWLKNLNEIEIIIQIFRNDLDEQIFFKLNNLNWNEFLNIFKNLSYDGATNFYQLSTINLTQIINYYFLFSDCISTINNNLINENFLLNFQAPIWIINGNYLYEPFDYDFMRYLTQYRSYGGGYLNREKFDLDSNELISIIQTIQIKYVKIYSNENFKDIYPSKSIIIPLNSERFLLVGKYSSLIEKSIEFQLEFSMNNQIAHVPIVLNKSLNYFGLIRRLWAQEKLNELNIFKEKFKTEILHIGLEYSLVSQYTSLLVLETLQQHLQYHICPAKTRLSLYNDYMRLKTQENQNNINNLNELINKWNNKCQWYDHDNTNQLPSSLFHSNPVPSTTFFNQTFIPTPPTFSFGSPSSTGTPSTFSFGSTSYPVTQPVFSGVPTAAPPTFGFGSTPPSMAQSAFTGSSTTVPSAFGSTIPIQPSSSKTEETSTIILTEYNPQSTYMSRISLETNITNAYTIYLNERILYRQSPSFYFDIASYFFQSKFSSSIIDKFNQKTEFIENINPKSIEYGLRILTNILELEYESPQLYRTVAFKLIELKQWNFVLSIFEKIYLLRSDEPQSLYDLALIYIELNQYEKALEYFKKILKQTWDIRFNNIHSIVLSDFNRLINLMIKTTVDIDSRFIRHLPVDLRIVARWDTPDTIIQLIVNEPNGQINQNGYNINMFQQGSSTIEYLIHQTNNGRYSINVTYISNAQHTLTGVTTVLVYIYKYFGSIDEEKQIITIRLTNLNQTINIGQIEYNHSYIKKRQQLNIQHLNITCDNCLKTPIIGDRYKCLFCPNIDFCQNCYDLSTIRHDSTHLFMCIHDSSLYKSSIYLQNMNEMIHLNTHCAGCNASPIIGTRYQCTICPINLCEKCEFLCLHDISHQRLKIILPSEIKY